MSTLLSPGFSLEHLKVLRDFATLRQTPLEARQPSGPMVPERTLLDFVTQRPWQIDRHPFDWANHQYLLPLYEAFRVDPQANDELNVVVQKGAQVGLSVWAMLSMIFLAVKFPGRKLGFFLPDQAMSFLFSGDRFKPMVQSNPAIGGMLGEQSAGTDNM